MKLQSFQIVSDIKYFPFLGYFEFLAFHCELHYFMSMNRQLHAIQPLAASFKWIRHLPNLHVTTTRLHVTKISKFALRNSEKSNLRFPTIQQANIVNDDSLKGDKIIK